MLVDTDVFIWYMRGNENARQALEDGEADRFLSVVTYIELVQGMRNREELNQLRRALHSWSANILYLSEEISVKAMFFVERQFLNHSVQLADALIGATAIAHGLPLLTGNDKHYRILKGVKIKKFKN